LVRINLVDEMLRARPKMVVTRSMVGKIEKSTARLLESTRRRMISESPGSGT
jgi:hypothetical protein